MTDHMKVVDGEVQAQSTHGEQAIKRLDLNESGFFAYRKSTLNAIMQCGLKITETNTKLAKLRKKLAAGDLTQQRHDEWVAKFEAVKSVLAGDLAIMTGKVPLPP